MISVSVLEERFSSFKFVQPDREPTATSLLLSRFKVDRAVSFPISPSSDMAFVEALSCVRLVSPEIGAREVMLLVEISRLTRAVLVDNPEMSVMQQRPHLQMQRNLKPPGSNGKRN